MKLFSFKKMKVEVVYKNGQKKHFIVPEPSRFSLFIDKLKNNSFLFMFFVLPIQIIKGIVYSIYLKLK